MSKKIKEPAELVKVNCIIREYGGMYANWKSSGCKGELPLELLNKLEEIFNELDLYLTNYKGEKDFA